MLDYDLFREVAKEKTGTAAKESQTSLESLSVLKF